MERKKVKGKRKKQGAWDEFGRSERQRERGGARREKENGQTKLPEAPWSLQGLLGTQENEKQEKGPERRTPLHLTQTWFLMIESQLTCQLLFQQSVSGQKTFPCTAPIPDSGKARQGLAASQPHPSSLQGGCLHSCKEDAWLHSWPAAPPPQSPGPLPSHGKWWIGFIFLMLVCFSVLLALICLILPWREVWSHCNLWGKYLIRMLLNRVLFTWENVSWVNVQLGRLFSQESMVVPAGPILKYVVRCCLKHLEYLKDTLHLFLRNLPVATFIQLSCWGKES